MKKSILLIVLFLWFCLLSATAQTTVGGPISTNTVWDISGSPYLVQTNIALLPGITLTIDPGVTVKFNSQKSMQVSGTLRAIGSQALPIVFTSNVTMPNPGDWGYILFNSSSPPYNFSGNSGSILQHCIVEYAGGATVGYNGAVRMNNSFPYLNNCTIRYNSKPAVKAWNLNSTLFMDSCTIQYNNVDTGSVYASSGTLTLNTCTISNNITSIPSSDDFSVSGIFTVNTAMRIKFCTLNANNARAICGYKNGNNVQADSISFNMINNNLMSGIYCMNYCSFLASSDMANKTWFISNNTISGNSENGIYFMYANIHHCDSSACTITNNIISNTGGNGIYFNDTNGEIYTDTFTITNNIIKGNTGHGIYLNSDKLNRNTFAIDSNTIDSNNGAGIYYHFIGLSDYLLPNTFSITNNRINKNNTSGINLVLKPGSQFLNTPTGILIKKNKITGNNGTEAGGINLQSNMNCILNVDIDQNVIADNNTTGQGGGLYLSYNEANSTFTNNTLINNSALTSSAVYYNCKGQLQANNNTIVYNRSTGTSSRSVYLRQTQSFNHNNLYNSRCDTVTLWYDDFNSNILNAQSCYWRKNISTAVDSVIWDYFDDQNLGIVDHSNFGLLPDTLAPVTPVENLMKTNVGANVQLNWSPNSETDLAGYKIYWGSPTGYSFVNSVNVGNVTSYLLPGASASDTIAITAYDTQANGIDDQVEGHESWFSADYGCVFTTGIKQFTVGTALIIYPNPATNMLSITNISGKTSLCVYDAFGKLILKEESSTNLYLDISYLAPGMYTIAAESNHGKTYSKLIVTR